MANEYGELEQMVNDVTSLDTARMTLRWALERLNTIEKEKADLKKGLTLAEETAKRLQVKEASLQDAYSSRNKTLEEKEDFYTKLEATMSLLGEGKLDIQQLLKKEAKLDGLRKSLEAEYADKFEELDRSQRSIIERWNARLLEVESQYAGKLAESQKKYDSLRAELEADHQGRLSSLETSFKSRERDMAERLRSLEGNVLRSEEKVETRRRELEAEYLAKKKETEENYRKLKGLLEAGLDERQRAMDSDHAAQVRSLEASWQTERARLLDEQRVRDEQYFAAQARIKEIENALASQQEVHHNELLKIITEKETAFRAQLAGLEKEKAAKEEAARELVARLEKKSADWEGEKARLEAEFGGRIALMEKSLRERAAALEREYSGKKEELENIIAVNREETEKEFNARLLAERQSMEAEQGRLAAAKAAGEEAFLKSESRVRELEGALAASREEHHKELMDRIRASEAAFREKLGNFEEEKRAYNDTIKGLAGELRAKNGEMLAEKQRFEAEIARIAAENAASADERLAAVRADYEARKSELAARAEALEADHASRRERFETELSARAAALNSEAETKMAFERKNWQAERARFEGQLEEISGKFRDSQKQIEAISAGLRRAAEENAAREAAFNKELMEAKANYDRELTFRVKDAVSVQTAHLVEALEAARKRQEEAASSLEAKDNSIAALRAEAARARREFEETLASAAADAVAARRAEMEQDLKLRREALAADFDLKNSRLAEENEAMKDALAEMSAAAAEANARSAELSSRLLAAEKNAAAEKLEMQKEQVRELDAAVSGAVAAAMDEMERKVLAANEELERVRKEGVDEVRHIKEVYAAEKERIFEEMDRRERYIESADIKIQELEREMMKYRQSASGELLKQISEQDERFRTLVAAEKERNEARVKQLESLLSAKEKMLADADKFYRQKQLELDSLHASLNQRVSEFNEDLFAQKQALGEKERALNDYRLKLEKEYSVRTAELEQMKAELSRAIAEYKGRK